MAATAEGNVGLAFGLVIIAGLSTTIGSMFVFCSDYANVKLLAGALGISAGVMIYVSFGEIFGVKAVDSFEEIEGIDGAEATRYATFCFFWRNIYHVSSGLVGSHDCESARAKDGG